MYLIAACLPSLRPVVAQAHRTLGSILASMLRTFRSSNPPKPNDHDTSTRPRCRCQDPQLIDVKVTGVGILETLLRDAEAIGASNARSISSA